MPFKLPTTPLRALSQPHRPQSLRLRPPPRINRIARPNHHRTLSTTPPLPSKQKHSAKRATLPPPTTTTTTPDPFDFSDYDAAVARARAVLEEELKRVRRGERDPEVLEGIRVRMKAGEGGKGKGQVVRVGDLASVVRRGRNVEVVVGERDVSFFLWSWLGLVWGFGGMWKPFAFFFSFVTHLSVFFGILEDGYMFPSPHIL